MTVKIKDKKFKVAISSEKIQKRVSEIAQEMNQKLAGKDVVLISILNGSFMFASDLMKKITFDAKITFLKLASYDADASTGKVKRLIGINESLKDKTVVVIEDIVDTGITMESILWQLKGYQPKEVIIASLLFKKEAFKKDYKIDYIGFDMPNEFLIGYGLDYDGYGRNYGEIYSLILGEKKEINNVLLFGAPGSGKGTQSKEIIKKYNLVHLSTGDILRYAIETNTKLGQEAKQYMDRGGFVPDKLVLDLIEQRLEMNIGTSGFIFDGFPRTVEQAKSLDDLMNKKNLNISGMIALDVEIPELKQRLLKRAKTGNRVDDTPEIIENRIRIYKEKTAPVMEYYKERNKLHVINGSGKIDDIFKEISKIMDTF